MLLHFDTYLMSYLILGNFLFLMTFVVSFLVWQNHKAKARDLQPGTRLEYRNLGRRRPKSVPQVVIHSKKHEYYLTQIQSRDKRRGSQKLYRLHASEVERYFNLAS